MFGAPVLSASVAGETKIEDPTYNPTTPTTQTATPITAPEKDEEEPETFSISIEDGSLEIEMEETTRNSLIGVLVVIVLVFACTGAAATAVLCLCGFGTTAKTTFDIQQKLKRDAEAKKNNQLNASESQLEVDNQYVLPAEIDIDIFASKKRAMKVNH